MSTATIKYVGGLRTACTHVTSGNSFITDAPIDNNGKGEAFSPTDIVATGLASCMLTVMGIKAEQLNVSLDGATAAVTKTMASDPRRISNIKVVLQFPSVVSEKEQAILERTANTCPVHYSLHPDIEKDISFIWG
ncbi:MAG: putative redox protein [Planctomycetota bacterium]|jgi:putative redox protein|uniref:OsmC family protein n=1 Tax=Patiriisocius sp. Uisw_047 TaxID=3230969 RepID=UPI0039EB3C45